MKAEQKAVIARAQRDGLNPSDLAAELLTHDLVNSALGVVSEENEMGGRSILIDA
jgi:hypothetical protein